MRLSGPSSGALVGFGWLLHNCVLFLWWFSPFKQWLNLFMFGNSLCHCSPKLLTFNCFITCWADETWNLGKESFCLVCFSMEFQRKSHQAFFHFSPTLPVCVPPPPPRYSSKCCKLDNEETGWNRDFAGTGHEASKLWKHELYWDFSG